MLEFTQEEFESELNALLAHGRRKDIARICGLHESTIKRQFNPDDETPSAAYRLLQIVCALDELDTAEGEAFWQALTRFRELSRKRRPNAAVCLNRETGALNKEFAEYVSARISNKPFNEQISEFLDIETQMVKVKQCLIDEHNRLKSEKRSMARLKIIQ